MLHLQLKRPLIVFDIESTGLNPATDRIVELSYIKVHPGGKEESETLRFNPGIPISPEATAITGIHDEDVADMPSFKEKAAEIAAVFRDCDLAGFNSNVFDVPLLVEEFLRAGAEFDVSRCQLIDVQNIYHKMEPRTLSAAYRFYCDKDLENAHSAMSDTRATYEVLLGQLDRYSKTLDNDVTALADFSRRNRNIDLAGRIVENEEGVAIFNFGKHKGKPVEEVLRREPGFYAWMMQGDFTQNTKQTLTRLRLLMK